MPAYTIDQLLQDPDFQKKPYENKVRILKGAGLGDAEAKQRALEVERRRPPGASVMDYPPGQEPGLFTRGVQAAGRLARDAGPSIVGGQTFRHIGGFFPGVRALPPEVREGIGSATGEAISQLLDKTKPFNVEQIIGAGVVGGAAGKGGGYVPQASRPIGKGFFRWMFKHAPGSTEAFQQVAADELYDNIAQISARTQQMLPPGSTVDDLWTQALRGNQVSVPMSNTRTAAQEVAAEIALAEEMGFVEPGWKKTLTTLANKPSDPTLKQLDLTRRGLEDMMGVYRDQPNVIGRQTKYVLRGVFKDIDDAAERGIPEAITLQKALAVSKRELSTNSLLDYLDSRKALTPPAPGDNTQYMKVNRVLDDLRRVRDGNKPPRELALLDVGLDASEIDDMISTLEYWNEYTAARTSPRGTNVGSGPTLAAGAVGYAASGGDPQTAAAFAFGRWVFVRALSHPQGRQAIRQLIRQGADVNLVDLGIQAMGQIMRTAAPPYMQQIGDWMQGPKLESNR